MTVKINSALKEQLLGRIPGIQIEGNSTFIMYDRISIDTVTGTATFSWKGKDMFTIAVDNYSAGNVLVLNGFDGRTQVSLSS